MKKFKYALLCLFMVLSCAVFSACSDDDKDEPLAPVDEENFSAADLVGAWQDDRDCFVFESDGKITIYDFNRDNPKYYDRKREGSWRYSSYDFTVSIIWSNGETVEYKVTGFSANILCFTEETGYTCKLKKIPLSQVPVEKDSEDDPTGDDDPEVTPSWEVADSYDSGNGSASSPYIIKTAPQLRKLAADCREGFSFRGKYFKLGANIRINRRVINENYSLVVPDSQLEETSIEGFDGTFDGGGFTIYGLYGIKQGVFLNTKEDAIFKNIVLKDSYIGRLIHELDEPITLVDNVINYGFLGVSMVSRAKTISNCGNYGKCGMSGIADYVYNRIINCDNYGEISVERVYAKAGIVMTCYGDVLNCVNFGKVLSTNNSASGIVIDIHSDYSNKTCMINNCVNYGRVKGWYSSGSNLTAAGIAGRGRKNNSNQNSLCKYSYYLETSAPHAFTYNEFNIIEVLSMTEDEMMSDEFLATLNANASQISGACQWKRDSSGFPTLEIVK